MISISNISSEKKEFSMSTKRDPAFSPHGSTSSKPPPLPGSSPTPTSSVVKGTSQSTHPRFSIKILYNGRTYGPFHSRNLTLAQVADMFGLEPFSCFLKRISSSSHHVSHSSSHKHAWIGDPASKLSDPGTYQLVSMQESPSQAIDLNASQQAPSHVGFSRASSQCSNASLLNAEIQLHRKSIIPAVAGKTSIISATAESSRASSYESLVEMTASMPSTTTMTTTSGTSGTTPNSTSAAGIEVTKGQPSPLGTSVISSFPPIPSTSNLEEWLDYMDQWTVAFRSSLDQITPSDPFVSQQAAYHFLVTSFPHFPGTSGGTAPSHPTSFLNNMASFLDKLNDTIHQFHGVTESFLAKSKDVAERKQRRNQVTTLKKDLNSLYQLLASLYCTLDQEEQQHPQYRSTGNLATSELSLNDNHHHSTRISHSNMSLNGIGLVPINRSKERSSPSPDYYNQIQPEEHFILLRRSRALPPHSAATDYIYNPTYLLRPSLHEKPTIRAVHNKRPQQKTPAPSNSPWYLQFYERLFQKFKLKFLDTLLQLPIYKDKDIQQALETQLDQERHVYELNRRQEKDEKEVPETVEDAWLDNYPVIYIRNRCCEFLSLPSSTQASTQGPSISPMTGSTSSTAAVTTPHQIIPGTSTPAPPHQ